ncbi:MAG: Bifunctional transcriptional activator/DNA repair enzyme AdaA [Firmicutes bacterium ADurb.Bin146]|nr:MAG: Bifunctional transcriptional activator/DNA repair enzyme AdaA [Firmicutes bacterium ADurb.Bin146]
MYEDKQQKNNHVRDTIISMYDNKELLAKIIDFFPYPVQIFSIDGTAKIINDATLKMIGIKKRENHIGIYNVFRDPIIEELECMDEVKQVLTGKTVYLKDFNVPYKRIRDYFDLADKDVKTISSDITCFPLYNDEGVIENFAAVFLFKNVYSIKEEISRAKKYIDTHWQEPFNTEAISKVSFMSKKHFSKLFKEQYGMTPHEYYIDLKISRLKEKLLNNEITISQAFSECNIDYTGYYIKLFKEKTGYTPSEYRNNQNI